MSKLDHRELMQWYDGELGEERRRELTRLLETDPEAKQVWFGLVQVGEVVRQISAEQTESIDVTSSVMDRIRRSDSEGRRLAETAEGLRRSRRQVGWYRLRRALVPVAAGLAAAAALAVWVRMSHQPLPGSSPGISSLAPPTTIEPSALPPSRQVDDPGAADAPSIQAVDFGGQSGTIFLLEGAENSTFVVWLSESGNNESKIGTL